VIHSSELPNEEAKRLQLLARLLPIKDRKALKEEIEFSIRLKEFGYQILKVHYEISDSKTKHFFSDVDVLALSPKGEIHWFELKNSLGFFNHKKPKIQIKRRRQLRRLQKMACDKVSPLGVIDKVFFATLEPISPEGLLYLRTEYSEVLPFAAKGDFFGPISQTL